MILVAPTEHAIHNLLPSLGEKWKISTLPEKHGCDLFIPTRAGIIGYQRKTLPDLVASLQDGRLYYELNQLSTTATVSTSYLVVESSFDTDVTNTNYIEANISVSTLHTLIAKFHLFGVGYLPTATARDTVTCALSVARYLASGRADVLHRPKQTTNEWGRTDSRSYGIFLLQSFPGIGPKVAAAIYDHFNGVPISWSVTAADLARVPGIGRKRAEALMASLAVPSVPPSPAVAAAGG